MKRIDEKNYVVDELIELIFSNKESEKVLEYVIKIHKHHNEIDLISPVLNINQFDKNDDSAYWLIKYDNKIVGFLNLIYRNQDIEDTLEIHRFFIDEEFRKYGIGSKIIDFIKKEANNMGYRGLTAKVYCNNPSIKFYENNNFDTYYRYMFVGVND